MPYVPDLPSQDRVRLDPLVDALAKEIKDIAAGYNYDGAFAGELNYAVTTLGLKVLPARRYWAQALLSGVFHNIADEFYWRYMRPYENEQIIKNGDCYPNPEPLLALDARIKALEDGHR